MTGIIAKRVKLAREKLQMSQDDLAVAASVSQSLIFKIENGLANETRKLYQLSNALKAHPSWLMGEIGTDLVLIPYSESHLQSNVEPATIGRVTVRGHVQAGHWAEAIEFTETESYLVPSSAIPDEYPANKIYGLIVKGDSMDTYYREGALLVCIGVYNVKRKLQTGDHVIVEREYKGKYEATVKELEIDQSGKMTLWPRSSNPDHKSPLVITHVQGDNLVNDILIRITGVVLTSVSITKRF